MLAAALLLAGCGRPSPSPAVPKSVSWPAADAALRTSKTWRGGDAAYSVALGGDRVLWLFGDSFVGVGDGTLGRGGRSMVRNSVAIQSGSNPATAGWRFFWKSDAGTDAAFFPGRGDAWLWPGPATATDDGLVLMFAKVEASSEGLGFETVGSTALRVPNTQGPPSSWSFEPVELPAAPPGVQLGLGAHHTDDTWLYAFAPVEPGTHDVFLARASLHPLDLSSVQWWDGAAWNPNPNTARAAVRDVQTEFSVSRVGQRLWLVSTQGFGATDVVVRTAARPEGPWSAPRRLYRPPEFGRDDVLVYSAKVHPHLTGAPVVLTYNTNRTDFWDLAGDLNVYFPRFVTLTP